MGAGDAEPRPRGRDGGVTLGNSDFRFRPSIPLACGARLRSLVRMRAPSLPPSLPHRRRRRRRRQPTSTLSKQGGRDPRPSVRRPSFVHPSAPMSPSFTVALAFGRGGGGGGGGGSVLQMAKRVGPLRRARALFRRHPRPRPSCSCGWLRSTLAADRTAMGAMLHRTSPVITHNGETWTRIYRLVQKKGTVLQITSLAWPAVADCSRAETFSQFSAIFFAQPCTPF